jgi:hypothetical protein
MRPVFVEIVDRGVNDSKDPQKLSMVITYLIPMLWRKQKA